MIFLIVWGIIWFFGKLSEEASVTAKNKEKREKEKEVVERISISKDKEIRKEEYVNKKSKLRSLLRDDKITDKEYNFDLKQLDKEYAYTKIENQNKDWFNEMMDILEIAKESSKIFASGNDIKAKKEILSKLGSNLVWNEENLFIYNKKSINKLVEGIKGIKSEFPEFEPKNFLVKKAQKKKQTSFRLFFLLCSVGRDRTYDQLVNSQLLYR